MSISVPTIRWTDERSAEWSDLIRRGSETLSQRLGHQPAPATIAPIMK
jgi:hypothetical protein